MKRGYDDGDILCARTPRVSKASRDKSSSGDKSPSGIERPKKSTMVDDPRKQIPVNEPGWLIQVDKLTNDQLSRYSAWKTSVFSREDISEMITPYASVEFSDVHVSMVAACAKMLVGDLVEEARIHRGDAVIPITAQDIESSSGRLSRRRILPDYCPIVKRRNYKIPKPDKPYDHWSF